MSTEFYYNSETARGQYSGGVFLESRRAAANYAKSWSKLDGGRREITIMETDDESNIIWSVSYAGGVRQN